MYGAGRAQLHPQPPPRALPAPDDPSRLSSTCSSWRWTAPPLRKLIAGSAKCSFSSARTVAQPAEAIAHHNQSQRARRLEEDREAGTEFLL
jgi:hypothetical protein